MAILTVSRVHAAASSELFSDSFAVSKICLQKPPRVPSSFARYVGSEARNSAWKHLVRGSEYHCSTKPSAPLRPAADALRRRHGRDHHRRARPLAFSRRLSARKAAHTPRTQPSARHHSRAGTSRRVGALVRLNMDLRSDSAAARRCPWQQQVPPHHPPAASASLSHATPPPMHTSNATSDPAATGSIRGDEASASTDHHKSSVKLHVFALCR